MNTTETTLYTIYNQRLAGYLMQNGIPLLNIVANHYTGRNNFIFSNTPKLHEFINQWQSKSAKSSHRYYATYKGIGESDIVGFRTEAERDDWVNFKDPDSLMYNTTLDNCTFERMAMPTEEAEKRIKSMRPFKYKGSSEMKVYLRDY